MQIAMSTSLAGSTISVKGDLPSICLLQSHLATVINYPKINNVIHVPRSFMKSSSTVHHAPTFTGQHDNKREARVTHTNKRKKPHPQLLFFLTESKRLGSIPRKEIFSDLSVGREASRQSVVRSFYLFINTKKRSDKTTPIAMLILCGEN